MNKTRLGIGLLALVLLALLLWLGRGNAPSTREAPPTVDPVATSKPPQPTVLENATLDQGAERAAIAALPDAAETKPTELATLRVLVLDKTTQLPLKGANVIAQIDSEAGFRQLNPTLGSRGKAFEMLTTDADGRVEIEMSVGSDASVRANGRMIEAGHAEVAVPKLAAGETRELVMQLATGDDLPFWLQLVDESTREPIPWASVTVSNYSNASQTDRELTTDARGIVFCASRAWAISTIRVEPTGRSHFFVEPESGHSTVETALVVAVPASATVRVQITDAAGTAVRDAKVLLKTEVQNLNRGTQRTGVSFMFSDPSWSAKTNEAGVATLSKLPPRVPLRASLASPKPWNAAEPIVLTPGEERSITWKLSGGAMLRGVVVDQHEKPVTERSMWLRPAEGRSTTIFNEYSSSPTRTTKTNADGRFEFADVDAGGWSVGPSAPSITTKVSPNDVVALAHYVEVGAEDKDVEVTIRVDRGLFIRGRVLAPDGTPPRWGAVQAFDPITRLATGAQLKEATGKFEVGPLMAGRYVLRADGDKHATSERIEADAGAEGVELRLNPGGSLTGRVVALDGTALEAKIVVSQRNSKTADVAFPETRKGVFKMEGLAPATFDLAATTSDGSTGVLEGIELASGEKREDLTITVVPGGRVRVRHDGPDKYVGITILQRDILLGADGVQLGASREFVAPAGRVTIRASYREGEHRLVERIVDVKAGETVDVTFEKDAR